MSIDPKDIDENTEIKDALNREVIFEKVVIVDGQAAKEPISRKIIAVDEEAGTFTFQDDSWMTFDEKTGKPPEVSEGSVTAPLSLQGDIYFVKKEA